MYITRSESLVPPIRSFILNRSGEGQCVPIKFTVSIHHPHSKVGPQILCLEVNKRSEVTKDFE